MRESLSSREDVLRFLCGKVTQSGLADAGLEASVFEREAVAPTCFGNLVAIPHPMTPKPLQLLGGLHAAKPIVWENKRVQFVCLLCVEKDNTANLQEMYKFLGRVLDDRAIVRELLKCKTYWEFMSVFKKAGRLIDMPNEDVPCLFPLR